MHKLSHTTSPSSKRASIPKISTFLYIILQKKIFNDDITNKHHHFFLNLVNGILNMTHIDYNANYIHAHLFPH